MRLDRLSGKQAGAAPRPSFRAFHAIKADWDGVVLEISTNGGIDDVAITDASTPEACFATDLLFTDGFEAGK